MNLPDINLEQLEDAIKWVALLCGMLAFATLLGLIQTVWQLRQAVRRRFRKTETERRIGRDRL